MLQVIDEEYKRREAFRQATKKSREYQTKASVNIPPHYRRQLLSQTSRTAAWLRAVELWLSAVLPDPFGRMSTDISANAVNARIGARALPDATIGVQRTKANQNKYFIGYRKHSIVCPSPKGPIVCSRSFCPVVRRLIIWRNNHDSPPNN